jgi:hypothetical protein
MYTLAGCGLSLSGTPPDQAWKGDHYDVDVIAKRLVDRLLKMDLGIGSIDSISRKIPVLGKFTTAAEGLLRKVVLKQAKKLEAKGTKDTADIGMAFSIDILDAATTELGIISPTVTVDVTETNESGDSDTIQKTLSADDPDVPGITSGQFHFGWNPNSHEGTDIANLIRDAMAQEFAQVINEILEEAGIVKDTDKQRGPGSTGGKYGPPDTLITPSDSEISPNLIPAQKVEQFVYLIAKLAPTPAPGEEQAWADDMVIWMEKAKQPTIDYAKRIGVSEQDAITQVEETFANIIGLFFTVGFHPATVSMQNLDVLYPGAVAFRHPETTATGAGGSMLPLAIAAGVILLLVLKK